MGHVVVIQAQGWAQLWSRPNILFDGPSWFMLNPYSKSSTDQFIIWPTRSGSKRTLFIGWFVFTII